MDPAVPLEQPREMSKDEPMLFQRVDELPSRAVVKRWDGKRRIATPWNSLRRDSELWFEDGECFVYLYRPGQSQRGPSFRIPYQALIKANCNNLLALHLISTWDCSPYATQSPVGECYLYLHAPSLLSAEEAFQYHIDTRNFFAWAVGVPLVGTDPISALDRLKARLETWCEHPADILGFLITYVKEQGYSDSPEPTVETAPKRRSVCSLPSPSQRREAFQRLRLPIGHGRRHSMIVESTQPRAFTNQTGLGIHTEGMRKSYQEIVIPNYGNGIQGRRSIDSTTSTSSTSDYGESLESSPSRDISLSSSISSERSLSTSPVTPLPPELQLRRSSHKAPNMMVMDAHKSEEPMSPEIRTSDQDVTDQPQELLIEALLEELTKGNRVVQTMTA